MSSSNALWRSSWEKYPERPNRLSINVTLFATLNCRRLEQFGCNYDHIGIFLKTFPSRPHTDLLETLLDEIVEGASRMNWSRCMPGLGYETRHLQRDRGRRRGSLPHPRRMDLEVDAGHARYPEQDLASVRCWRNAS